MKTLSKKLPVLIITICSLFALNSCASTPEAQEIPQSAQEQTKAEDEKADSASITEDSQDKTEEEVLLPVEKVDETEILGNETETERSSTDFTEPDVLDAVIEESEAGTDDKSGDPAAGTGETENILPEKVEDAAQDLESAQIQNSSEQDTENKELSANRQAETEENFQAQGSQESEENTTTVNTENTQQTDADFNSPSGKTENENLPGAEAPQEEEAESLQDSSVVPSRTMSVKNNQYVDVVYPGRGWIYIGEENENADQLFRYFGRKLGSEDTTFTVRSIKSGKTLLHFYKNDVLTGNYIDDYLEILVTEEGASANERITAPSYAEVVPKKVNTANTNENSTSGGKTEQQTAAVEDKKEENSTQSLTEQKNLTDQITEQNYNSTAGKTDETKVLNEIQQENNVQKTNEVKTADSKNEKSAKKHNSSGSLLEQAKESLKNKDYENALNKIQEYLDTKNTKIDEALYIQGQILEADSSVRNIKSAIDSYDSLIKHYPASRFWQDANKRKIYLNRYYINIY